MRQRRRRPRGVPRRPGDRPVSRGGAGMRRRRPAARSTGRRRPCAQMRASVAAAAKRQRVGRPAQSRCTDAGPPARCNSRARGLDYDASARQLARHARPQGIRGRAPCRPGSQDACRARRAAGGGAGPQGAGRPDRRRAPGRRAGGLLAGALPHAARKNSSAGLRAAVRYRRTCPFGASLPRADRSRRRPARHRACAF